MSLRDDYIKRLENENALSRGQLCSLENGEVQFGERHSGGDWTDKTQTWINELKRRISVNEAIIAEFKSGEPI
jgi:hypothetical protein